MSNSLSSSQSSASVRNILTLLSSRDAQLVAGGGGIERRVTWACRMRARLPAFESVQGGELALLTLAQLRRLDETLPHLLKSLHQAGVAVVAVAAPSVDALGSEALDFAAQVSLPLILLPSSSLLEEIEREVITFVVSFRGETERKATEISNHLMQLSVQGAGIQGVCEYLANSRGKWVVVQDVDHHFRFQAAPRGGTPLNLPNPFTDEQLRHQGLTRVMEPIPSSRHEIVGYFSLIGHENDFDYLERIILSKVTPILAIEFARERERSEVESRYQAEAFTDVLHGHYQQPEEMMARARLLGYDLSTPQVVCIFEVSSSETDFLFSSPAALWSKRIRDELVRMWSGCWIMEEARRVIAILPLPPFEMTPEAERECENNLYSRLERVIVRVPAGKSNGTNLPTYSCGVGRIVTRLQGISPSFREAQQALEIGCRLFGEGNLHSFARLGVYRLLFHLNGHSELSDFYQEMLGPLLVHDDTTYIETLEGFFRCNGNLSEMARTMHFHRNSLLYRLNRIEVLLGRSLEDPELRLSLQIALKIYHLRKH